MGEESALMNYERVNRLELAVVEVIGYAAWIPLCESYWAQAYKK